MAWHFDQVILIFEVGVRRPFVSLAAKENVDGRLELLWGSWARISCWVFCLKHNICLIDLLVLFGRPRVLELNDDGRCFDTKHSRNDSPRLPRVSSLDALEIADGGCVSLERWLMRWPFPLSCLKEVTNPSMN